MSASERPRGSERGDVLSAAAPSRIAPTTRRISASGPGVNECAAERIAMNADAHRTSTATTAAGIVQVGLDAGGGSAAAGRSAAGGACAGGAAKDDMAAGGTVVG